MLETSWLWFVISKEYVELTRPKIESRDPIFFTGTRSRSRVSGNDRLFPRGSEFGPNLEIPAGPAIQLRPGPVHSRVTFTWMLKISILKLHLKFSHLKSQPLIPGNNESTQCAFTECAYFHVIWCTITDGTDHNNIYGKSKLNQYH